VPVIASLVVETKSPDTKSVIPADKAVPSAGAIKSKIAKWEDPPNDKAGNSAGEKKTDGTAEKANTVVEKKTVADKPVNVTTKSVENGNTPSATTDGTVIYKYEELKDKNFWASHKLNDQKIETYLTNEEFHKVFHMSREEFYKLPSWKQRDKKKQSFLF